MVHTLRARPGRLLALALVMAAFVAAITGGVAYAADQQVELDPSTVQRLFEELQSSPVAQEVCLNCHGNIAETDNYASEIRFTHANHIVLQCNSCHTSFPHRPEGTAVPTMKGCFDCHGVRHGPMGALASGECADCHVSSRESLRPAFHTWDWAQKPHVAPSNKEFNTRCAMCHTPESCTDCHDAKGIKWSPSSWDYDSDGGCLSCHGSSLTQKATLGGTKSFQVTGLEDSAHQNLTCQNCHTDYRYDDKPAPTPLWNINVSYACANCHKAADTGDAQKDKRSAAAVTEYEKSTHAAAITDGNYDSATCGSCHGGHFIYSLDTEVNKQRLHLSAYRICARCKQHGNDYDTYDDYYHGRAYKAEATDAPACWDCHNSHDIRPASDKASSVNAANVGKTCGREGCHKGSSQKFGTDAAALIHQKAQAEADNWLLKQIDNIRGR